MKDLNQLIVEAQKLAKSIKFSVEVITPEIAVKYLNTSIGNRNIKKDTITALVNALTKGTFEVNGETIVFDQNGSLMDSGTARSLGDVFKFEGIPNYNSVSTIVAGTFAMIKNKVGINTLGSGNKLNREGLSRKDALGLYYKYADIWQDATKLGANVRNKLPGLFTIKEVGIISAYLMIYLHHSLEKVSDFWNLVVNGDGIYASLRNLFLKDMQETRFKKMSAQSRQSCIACVWNRYLVDKKAKRVQYVFTEVVMFN